MAIMAILFIVGCFAIFAASVIIAIASRKARVVASIFACLAFLAGGSAVAGLLYVISSMN